MSKDKPQEELTHAKLAKLLPRAPYYSPEGSTKFYPLAPQWGFRVRTTRENGRVIWITEARYWDGEYRRYCDGVPIKSGPYIMKMFNPS